MVRDLPYIRSPIPTLLPPTPSIDMISSSSQSQTSTRTNKKAKSIQLKSKPREYESARNKPWYLRSFEEVVGFEKEQLVLSTLLPAKLETISANIMPKPTLKANNNHKRDPNISSNSQVSSLSSIEIHRPSPVTPFPSTPRRGRSPSLSVQTETREKEKKSASKISHSLSFKSPTSKYINEKVSISGSPAKDRSVQILNHRINLLYAATIRYCKAARTFLEHHLEGGQAISREQLKDLVAYREGVQDLLEYAHLAIEQLTAKKRDILKKRESLDLTRAIVEEEVEGWRKNEWIGDDCLALSSFDCDDLEQVIAEEEKKSELRRRVRRGLRRFAALMRESGLT